MQGVEIGEENVLKLKEANYFKEDHGIPDSKVRRDIVNQAILSISTKKNKDIDSNIDIIETEDKLDSLYEIITDQEIEERRQRYGHKFEGRKEAIQKIEWIPESRIDHAPDFVAWINSINKPDGFISKIYYRKFSLYCQQAYTWLQEKKTSSDFEDDDERENFRQEELRRSDENALYFMNKYGYYKEGDDETGRTEYVAQPAHEIMAYLDDCGYSVGMAKARQIAATTTLMMLDVKDVIFKTNHFMKFITEDVEKAEEIFEDKLKYPFSQVPDWMRPNVLNERDNVFKIGYKQEKGKKEGVGSKIMVTAPKRTAIAGGAPQKVKIDEAGNISILGKMIGNARPTMLWYNPKTKKIQIKRMLWFWGTGGEMDKGGKSFEIEYMAILTKWLEGDYSSAIVPLFFNWRWRPGATQEIYDREKAVAYAKEGTAEGKQDVTEFHQSWPDSISDVFRTSSKTLVDDDFIEKNLERIRDIKKEHGYSLHQSGYFEPVYDLKQPAHEGSDVPFKIIDANFIPTEDIDPRASTVIFLHPKEKWVTRYYKGTDPIDTDTGLSYFASTVWDKHFKCPAAIMNWRTRDYHDSFLQSLLMSLYYDKSDVKKGIKELIESNRGTAYREYVKNKGFDDSLVLNYELPETYQNRTTINEGVGIDNKGLRSTMIVNKMFEVISAYGDNIHHEIIFEQLKTFTCTISGTGKEMWGPINKKYFRDDTLYSTTFAYICAEMCGYPDPVNKEKKTEKFKIEYRWTRDSNHKLRRVPVKIAAK